LYSFADAASSNPTLYADFGNPQSLNKYQYTYNNPLRYTDSDGHCPDGTPCPVLNVVGPEILTGGAKALGNLGVGTNNFTHSYTGKGNYIEGEASGGHYFLAIGKSGQVFLLMEDVQLLGQNIEDALEKLILGIQSEELLWPGTGISGEDSSGP
jgi:hypothetical protein